MTVPPLLVLTLLTPVHPPAAAGGESVFRTCTGLIPSREWFSVSGLPPSGDSTFTEIVYSELEGRSFRTLSSGPTAGFHPALGTVVDSDGWAGSFAMAGVEVAAISRENYSLSTSWRNLTLDYREGTGFLIDVNSESFAVAGAPETFTAGISPGVTDELWIGPAWCHDSNGDRLWLRTSFQTGPFSLKTGGAVAGDNALPRAFSAIQFPGGDITAGYDGEGPAGMLRIAGLITLACPDWGFSAVWKNGESVLISLSHGQGGKCLGEVQVSFLSVILGLSAARSSEGACTAGFSAGISI